MVASIIIGSREEFLARGASVVRGKETRFPRPIALPSLVEVVVRDQLLEVIRVEFEVASGRKAERGSKGAKCPRRTIEGCRLSVRGMILISLDIVPTDKACSTGMRKVRQDIMTAQFARMTVYIDGVKESQVRSGLG